MQYLDENFLLQGASARVLYHQVAKDLPIYDYHCHLSPREILENRPYQSIGQMMLGGDHYKWRIMRANGTSEALITGDAPYLEKFQAYAQALEYAPGNPLAHWTNLELQRVFGIHEPLTPATAGDIFGRAAQQLERDDMRPRGLIGRFGVKMVCTTDDPADSLDVHEKLREESLPFKVLPAFRPDKAMGIDKPGFAAYTRLLGKTAGVDTGSLTGLLNALQTRLIAFHALGARASDHGIDRLGFIRTDADTARRIYREALRGRPITQEEALRFRSYLLCWLGARYAELGWVQQYHISALRNNNTPMFGALGPDTGFDTIGDGSLAEPLSRLLDTLETRGQLPKTILYSLNPNDNYTLAAMIGNFQGGTPGKLQWGSAWWFNDQKEGMEAQMRALANVGLLGRFVGMLTDSRSFTSYTRHEYFRRIFCNLLGGWVDNGELGDDPEMLLRLVEDVCFHNAVRYFGMEMPEEPAAGADEAAV